MAERIQDLPNPYGEQPTPWSEPQEEPPPLAPTAAFGERRWFEMEHTADMMGRIISPGVSVGLAVEFVGYAEMPKKDRHMTNHRDPFHPAFLLTSANLRIRF